MSNENGLWQWLRDVVLPVGHYSRIEAPDTAPGFPDVFFSIGVGDDEEHYGTYTGTIELKHSSSVTSPFPDEKKGLHQSQLRWMKDEVAQGGTVWIFAQVRNLVYCIPGDLAPQFNGADADGLAGLATVTLPRDNPARAAELVRLILCDS